jgi:glyoxylase-like metal-dependent hydrolase (beta-lactamase superfamily II)
LKELVDGIYYFANLMSSQYLILDEEELTLIDTGIPGNEVAILRGIETLGLNGNGLTRILITHADSDHYGALGRLQAVTAAETCTTKAEAEAIQQGRASRELSSTAPLQKIAVRTLSPMMRAPSAYIDRVIKPGDTLPVSGGLIAIDSAGHTPGHVSYYLPEKRILFSGDSIFYKKGRFIPSYGINCWDEERARMSMQAQLELEPRIICGGHGIFRLDS